MLDVELIVGVGGDCVFSCNVFFSFFFQSLVSKMKGAVSFSFRGGCTISSSVRAYIKSSRPARTCRASERLWLKEPRLSGTHISSAAAC